MPDIRVTKEDVMQAIHVLRSRNQSLGINRLIMQIGHGSQNRVKMLRDQILEEELTGKTEQPVVQSSFTQDPFTELANSMRNEVERKLEASIAEIQTQADNRVNEALSRVETLQTELIQLQKTLDGRDQSLSTAENLINAMHKEIHDKEVLISRQSGEIKELHTRLESEYNLYTQFRADIAETVQSERIRYTEQLKKNDALQAEITALHRAMRVEANSTSETIRELNQYYQGAMESLDARLQTLTDALVKISGTQSEMAKGHIEQIQRLMDAIETQKTFSEAAIVGIQNVGEQSLGYLTQLPNMVLQLKDIIDKTNNIELSMEGRKG